MNQSSSMLRLVTLLCFAAAVLGTPLKRAPRLDGRIVGGEDVADIKDYPYQLSLQIAGTHECGAVIINENWALTAAQCVGGSILGMNIRSGTLNRVPVGSTDGIAHSVIQKVVHANYNTTTSDYDIALLRVDPAFEIDKYIGLPLQGEVPAPDDSDTTVLGWGNTHSGGVPANILQSVVVPVVNIDKCREAYDTVAVVTDNMICAGDKVNGGIDACQGDSGGPMVVKSADADKPDILVGLVSWGRGCALAQYPGVYTSVPAFADWIRDHSSS